ncbi:hypothetical protein NE237_005704 [Protea cynaroides]|uniref:Bifunctional inhibitor/plant lipid transfer protein/seed storage helical domain-containing protein n=1 Tax=Protea cynaroides TaxID=273540 RepID=A0A9Q0KL95_9MAGN|nr:hypothetical protein NE237_005704 [Protea cynaroides]
MMKNKSLFFSTLLLFSIFQTEPIRSASVEQDCENEFTKLSPCLTYATGKAVSPSVECCNAVSDIKNKNPVCLCYIIQQTHEGQASLKQMGVQEAKLIQLSTTCKLTNAKISDCPKLLKLSPGSADVAIFTNSSAAATSISTAKVSPPASHDSKSNGFKSGQVAGPTAIIVAAVTVFISVFPTGLSSLV